MKKKKMLAMVMVIIGLVVALLGCSSAEEKGSKDSSKVSEGKTSVAEQPVKFSYFRPTWAPATYSKGGAYEKEVFKLGNVEIDVQIVPVVDFDAKINTVLAGGDLPDVVWANGPVLKRDRELQEQGAYLKINKYLDQYPAIRAAVPDSVWDTMANENGDIYFLPNLVSPGHQNHTFYRKDWFDKLNIEEPKTINELVSALEIIKKSDLNGNGKSDTIPLTIGSTWSFKEMGTSFGFAKSGWEPLASDPNTIVPWFMKEKEIDAHFWLQDLYSQGLLDPEFQISKEPNFSDNKFVNGQAAVLVAAWSKYVDLYSKVTRTDPQAEIGIMSPLEGPDGTLGGIRPSFPVDRGFYISAQANDPDGIFRFLNWTLTEGSDLRRYGVEGKTYTVENGEKIAIPEGDRESDYTLSQIQPLMFLAPLEEKLDWDAMKRNFDGAGIGDKFEYSRSKYDEHMKVEYYDYQDRTIDTPIASDTYSKLWNDHMQTIVDSVIINKDVTKGQWMDALESWKAAGGDKIIEEQNRLQTDKSKPNYN